MRAFSSTAPPAGPGARWEHDEAPRLCRLGRRDALSGGIPRLLAADRTGFAACKGLAASKGLSGGHGDAKTPRRRVLGQTSRYGLPRWRSRSRPVTSSARSVTTAPLRVPSFECAKESPLPWMSSTIRTRPNSSTGTASSCLPRSMARKRKAPPRFRQAGAVDTNLRHGRPEPVGTLACHGDRRSPPGHLHGPVRVPDDRLR